MSRMQVFNQYRDARDNGLASVCSGQANRTKSHVSIGQQAGFSLTRFAKASIANGAGLGNSNIKQPDHPADIS